MRRELIGKSKFLSKVLRHDPASVGLELDEAGWVEVEGLVAAMRAQDPGFDRAVLEEIVATNDKRRFVLSPDGGRIRAAQGHSLGVELGLPAAAPPAELFHGTSERTLASILASGLLPGRRDYVHLSADVATARQVGSRHGPPVVLIVDARAMVAAGHAFHVADNGVWLTRTVPPIFLQLHTP